LQSSPRWLEEGGLVMGKREVVVSDILKAA
jgi:hypothetical protein